MDNNDNYLRPQAVSLMVRAAVVGAMTYYGIKMAVNLMDPTNSQKKKAKNKASVKFWIMRINLNMY